MPKTEVAGEAQFKCQKCLFGLTQMIQVHLLIHTLNLISQTKFIFTK